MTRCAPPFCGAASRLRNVRRTDRCELLSPRPATERNSASCSSSHSSTTKPTQRPSAQVPILQCPRAPPWRTSGLNVEVRFGTRPFQPIIQDTALPSRYEVRTNDSPAQLRLPDGTRIEMARIAISPAWYAGPGADRHGQERRRQPCSPDGGPLGRRACVDPLRLVARLVARRAARAAAGREPARRDARAESAGGSWRCAHHRGPERGSPLPNPGRMEEQSRQGRLSMPSAAKQASLRARIRWRPAGRPPVRAGMSPLAADVGLEIVPSPSWSATLSRRRSRLPGRGRRELPLIGSRSRGTRPSGTWSWCAGNDPLVTFPLAMGRYWTRIAARGTVPIFTRPTPPRELRVARIAVPEGSDVRSGGFVLPRGASFNLPDPAGLEVAQGLGVFLHKAPSSASRSAMTRRGPVARGGARLRRAGARTSAFPRAHRHVPAQRGLAHGPHQRECPRRGCRRRGSCGLPPKLVVLVGTTELPLTWRRLGDAWLARVEPQATPGPWVVRVEAQDPHGNRIGRAFMEGHRQGPVTGEAHEAVLPSGTGSPRGASRKSLQPQSTRKPPRDPRRL